MADNVDLTNPVGIALADEVTDGVLTTGKVQYVKIMSGVINDTTKVGATANGLMVDGSAVVQPVSGGVKMLDSAGTIAATVRDTSTGPAAPTDKALVVVSRDANANGQAAMAASAPVAIASDQTISVKATTQVNGTTKTRVVSVATTPAPGVNLKASAGKVMSLRLFNMAAYDVFFKFYDKASAPTVGTDTPIWTIPLKAGTGFSENFPIGDDFASGIAYGITKLQADSDTTAVAAGDVTGKIQWI